MAPMNNLKLTNYRIFILSAILWLTIDLASKNIVMQPGFDRIVLIEDILSFSPQTNEGIAFGIQLNFALQIAATFLILGTLLYIGFRHILPQKRNVLLNQILLGIIVGGAIGNLVNRLALGHVIDFIVLKPFPVFNIADLGITIGLIILFFLNIETKNQ